MSRRVVTGKTPLVRGSHARESATGQGIVHCIAELGARERRFDLESVDYERTRTLRLERGQDPAWHRASMVAVGDWKATSPLSSEGNYSLQAAAPPPHGLGGRHYPGTHPIGREEFFATPADIFIPAALEPSIGVPRGQGAEGQAEHCRRGEPSTVRPPTRFLRDRGIDLIPDALANRAAWSSATPTNGCRTSGPERWDLEEVEERLAKRIAGRALARRSSTSSRSQRSERLFCSHS